MRIRFISIFTLLFLVGGSLVSGANTADFHMADVGHGNDAFAVPPSDETKPIDLPITGVVRLGFWVGDLEKARAFYTGVLGFPAIELKEGAPRLGFKVNDDQYLEFSPNPTPGGVNRFIGFAFGTNDIKKLAEALKQRGLTPTAVVTDKDGNLTCSVKDPDGHDVKFVQYLPGSLQSKARGPFGDDKRISDHLLHVGFEVADLDRAATFYRDKLGCQITHQAPQLLTIMRVPGARDDLIELMLAPQSSPSEQRRSKYHISLEISDVQRAYEMLSERGVDGLRQPRVGGGGYGNINLADPNRVRIEFMRPRPHLLDPGAPAPPRRTKGKE